MDNFMNVRVEMFLDRKNVWTTVWAVYHLGRVFTLEFTSGKTCLTDRVEFALEAA
jgi:hypothetical protein